MKAAIALTLLVVAASATTANAQLVASGECANVCSGPSGQIGNCMSSGNGDVKRIAACICPFGVQRPFTECLNCLKNQNAGSIADAMTDLRAGCVGAQPEIAERGAATLLQSGGAAGGAGGAGGAAPPAPGTGGAGIPPNGGNAPAPGNGGDGNTVAPGTGGNGANGETVAPGAGSPVGSPGNSTAPATPTGAATAVPSASTRTITATTTTTTTTTTSPRASASPSPRSDAAGNSSQMSHVLGLLLGAAVAFFSF
ncbi:hypothetical protein HK102_013508 [Quaeritorhiza haematococci]|nr:hypothetical protein HK102_013508 [Quaeritorhiza haematococci]